MTIERESVAARARGWGAQALQFAAALLIVFLAKGALAEPFYVPSGSMEPTLLIGDALLASKFPYGYGTASLPIQISLPETGRVFGGTPKRGDVVVFRWPGDRSQAWVKRVVGLPGDRIQMRQGQLFINDRAAALKPDFTIGCKRILMSNSYYPALTQPNVELVTDPIRGVRARSILTRDGVEREIDTIILGTGFKVHDHPAFAQVRGRDGRTLAEEWEGSPRAYLGTAVPGFPNLFLLVGPNSAGGFNSIVFTSEAHINYVMACLEEMDDRGLESVELRREVYEAYNRRVDDRLSESVWNAGGCQSWYLDANGRNSTLWPDWTWRFRRRAAEFKLSEYRLGSA